MRRLSDFTLGPYGPSDEKRHFSWEPEHLPFQNPVNWHDEGQPKTWVWYWDTPVSQSLYTVPTGLSFLHVERRTPAKQIIKAGRGGGGGKLNFNASQATRDDTTTCKTKGAGSLTTDVFYFVPNLCFEAITWTWRTHWLIPIWRYSKGESLNKMRFLLASHESNERCLLSMQKHKTRI